MYPTNIEILATTLFAIAVAHTFLCSKFQHLAGRFQEGSIGENLFHLLGEVEVVFGLWAGVLTLLVGATVGWQEIVGYLESRNFTEPLFVFAIMTVAATAPIIQMTRSLVLLVARLIPLPIGVTAFFSCLVVGPLLGSLITEPAAMTVTALLLSELYFEKKMTRRLRYLTLAVLLVNISIGGVLTHFAAPPILMVAATWKWDTPFVFSQFGWRAILVVFCNAILLSAFAYRELREIRIDDKTKPKGENVKLRPAPLWLSACHLLFLAAIVINAHHAVIFVGVGLFFLGFAMITTEYQTALKIRESLLVAFFLGGLVVFGGLQKWWLQPMIQTLDSSSLFFGAAALTAFTDNAALTYLGAQVQGVSASFKYALVAGAVTGGGLTVIANAPNPVAFSILQDSFGPNRISAVTLFLAALPATLIAVIAFWVLP